MIYFRSDYSQGAHPKVLKAIEESNLEHCDGYGIDRHCDNAAKMIKELIGREDCSVHFMVGGTPCNITVISAALRPYESVISARSGHIYAHETGAIEASGHRIVTIDGKDGKISAEQIDEAMEEFQDEHTAKPKMVYISQPTETGTLYGKSELKALYEKCKALDLYLYIDGARLGAALTSSENDISIKDLAGLCDAFYIGGTKNGALFGEALVINNEAINDHFRWFIKRHGGMLAKGRLIGVQFEALLEGGENGIYFEMASHANKLARRLEQGLAEFGFVFYCKSPTNQIFPILPVEIVRELEKDFFFYEWAPAKDGFVPIRLVTGWGSSDDDVDAFLNKLKALVL